MNWSKLILVFSFSLVPVQALGQETSTVTLDDLLPESLLQDRNGDGRFNIVAFGDSLTRGVGDFNAPNQEVYDVQTPEVEAGYPRRVEALLKIGVSNLGRPGEVLSSGGIWRFAREIPARRPDIVIIGGGANDARERLESPAYFYRVQTMINIAKSYGVAPVLVTINPVCCGHDFLRNFIGPYNEKLRLLSVINDIGLADVSRAFHSTCQVNSCYLLNLPEGLHPNIEGYDVMGEVVIAALLRVNIFALDGASILESALQLPAGSITTRPDEIPASG